MISKFFTANSYSSIFLDQVWKDIILERIPNIFIHTWKTYDFVLIAAVFGIFLLYRIIAKDKIHPIVNSIVLTGIIFFFLAWVSDIFSIRLGLQLQLARNIYLPVIFSVFYFAALFIKVLNGKIKLISFMVVSTTVIGFCLTYRLKDGLLLYRPLSDYEKLAVWAGNNTSQSSIFVVPPATDGFRFWSGRSVVNESKEGGDGLYDRNFAISWDQREDLLEQDESLSPDKVAEIKSTFNAEYLVSQYRLNYPDIKSYGSWHLYLI